MLINKYKSWIEVSKNNLFWNLEQVRKVVGIDVKVLAIVKANAYGHGLTEIVTLLQNKVDFFGVDNIDEALKIRSLKIQTPILILGYIPFERLKEAAKENVSVAFYNIEYFERITKQNFKKPLKIHVKIETGMHRQGVESKDLEKFISFIKNNPEKVKLEGVYSHFADIDNKSFSDYQLGEFQSAINIFEKADFNNLIKHISASGGIFTDKKFHLNMVRAGLCLYGYFNSNEVAKKANGVVLKPVLTWKSVVAQIKFVEKDESVGYSSTWIAKEKTKIAIIPVGYYDGLDRGFSNIGRVLVSGKSVKIIGRVAMNMFMIDVTKISKINVGDEVVILNNKINADELANLIGTTNHEILARINPLLPKIVVD